VQNATANKNRVQEVKGQKPGNLVLTASSISQSQSDLYLSECNLSPLVKP
jgi:hypothetical protein